MTDIPTYIGLLACASLTLLGISMASATAQYMRSQEAQAMASVRGPVGR